MCLALGLLCSSWYPPVAPPKGKLPNIVLIYADDLGFGDVSSYGAHAFQTPAIDRLARGGLVFTDAHATSATCTPSRYGLLTGEYPWRRQGTGVAPGNAAMLIEPQRVTLATILQQAGYTTGVVGKWHLGLGGSNGPDWNAEIRPGPLDIGFDYAFIMPATGDRVPCVYVENRRVVGLDPNDPISVQYNAPIGSDPTGKFNPELLKIGLTHGHDQTIINGISRIGYMSGGKSARWVDEDMADVFVSRASAFIRDHADRPFFLFFSTHDNHVPRVPHPRFAGKSGLGPRGDAILELDWSVEQLLHTLDSLGKLENTLVLFSSDNGPVLDDGYADQAWELLGSHRPAGPWRGGKYSAFEGGTRVPFIAHWPAQIKPGTTNALFSQIDLLASFATLTKQRTPNSAPDSRNVLPVLLGNSHKGRTSLVEQGTTLALRYNKWKFIPPARGPKVFGYVSIESGLDSTSYQLYNLHTDPGETQNLASRYPGKVARFKKVLSNK